MAIVHFSRNTLLLFACGLFTVHSFKLASSYAPYHMALSAPTGFSKSKAQPQRISTLQMKVNAVSPENPLRVAVAGGGVGGLFVAYALQKNGMDVTVFEKTGKFARFGGPIQLASNALTTIKELDEDLFNQIMQKFTFTGTRRCGIKDGVRNEWFSVFKAIPGCAELFDLPYTGVINRPDLQEIMMRVIKDDTVMKANPVVSFDEVKDPKTGVKQVNVRTQNREKNDAEEIHENFDVVIGADGIWSNIRSQIWNENGARPGLCKYSGYTVFAGETVVNPKNHFFDDDRYEDVGYKVYIGPRKYFVTSDVGAGRIQWYAFLCLPPGTKARDSNVDFIKENYAGWADEIHSLLGATSNDEVEQRDLYDREPSVFKSWSKGHATMLGDACHPMMPNLGQGGCMALEDGYVLANLLSTVQTRDQIPATLQKYYYKRLGRTAVVQGLSRFSSDVIVNTFTTPFKMEEFMKDGLKYEYLRTPSVLTYFLQFLLPAIFWAQFSYLYSFSPRPLAPGENKELAEQSLARNMENAKKAWANLEVQEARAKRGKEGGPLGQLQNFLEGLLNPELVKEENKPKASFLEARSMDA